MTGMAKTGNGKKAALAAVVLITVAVVFGLVYRLYGPETTAGAKEITVEVVDDAGNSQSYTAHTDAEYLRQALEEIEGLKVEGTESDYGLMVETVNGVTADYSVDGAYWAFFVNGEYCNYGVDTQPVEDGQAYRIVYTTE